jgi:hypothetical protein
MKDEAAKTARLMKVAEAAVEEFDRQGLPKQWPTCASTPWH